MRRTRRPPAFPLSAIGNRELRAERAAGIFEFDYDATTTTTRRKAPKSKVYSEDNVLKDPKRRTMIATTRDVRRNFTIGAWMVNQHLDYVSTFAFQSMTGDKELDAEIENLVKWWSRPRNFDIGGRHSRGSMTRLLETGRVVDGDAFLLLLRSGHVQLIEGDRVATPKYDLPDGVDADEIVNGVRIAKQGGRARAYIICKRTKGGGVKFERMIRAGFMLQHANWARYDQYRGITPMAPAINTFRDVYQGFSYALAKMKVAQLLGLTIFTNSETTVAYDQPPEGEDSDGDGIEDEKYEVDFDGGPVKLELEPGDRAEILESKSPSGEFQNFSQMMIAAGLKALDIPYSFYDEGHTNYSGARQAWLQYEHSAGIKRESLQEILDRLTAWRLAKFIGTGALTLPRGMDPRQLRWAWIPRGIPWIDPLKEVKADVSAVESALTSRTRVLKRQGVAFDDVVAELAQEYERLREAGVPIKLPDAPKVGGA